MFEDQSVYLLAAQKLEVGQFPFLSFFDLIQKPPGVLIPAFLALRITDTPASAALICSLLSFLCHVANALLLARVTVACGHERLALPAASIYFFSFIGLTTAQCLFAEPFAVLLYLVSLLLLVRGRPALLCGIPLALALFFRPTALFALISGSLLVFRKGWTTLLAILLPSLFALAVTCCFLLSQGKLDAAYAALVDFNRFHPESALPLLPRLTHFMRYLALEILLAAVLIFSTRSWRRIKTLTAMPSALSLAVWAFVFLQLSMLLLNRSFFDHYLYELAPAVSLALSFLLIQASHKSSRLLLTGYCALSFVLFLDRYETGSVKLLECFDTQKVKSVITDLPGLIMQRGDREEWYWQRSQEEAYRKAELNGHFGDRESLGSKLAKRDPDAIILISEAAPSGRNYQNTSFQLKRPIRDFLLGPLGISQFGRSVSIALKQEHALRVTQCLYDSH